MHRWSFELRRIRRIPPYILIGKTVAKLLGLALGLFLLPVTALLHLFEYRCVTIFTDRIGHLALEPDCLIKEEILGRIQSRKWIMLAPPSQVSNAHLLSYWRPHLRIVCNQFVCFILACMSRWGLMRFDISHYIRAIGKAQAAYRIYSEWGTRPPILKLTEEDELWGQQMLHGLGLPDGAWFVCIHAREAGFSPIDEELHNYRNSDIDNLTESVREITRRGGWIIRMGDPTMRKFAPITNVIDYAHHRLKSDRLDIVLCAKARFFLGNTSGIAFVSTLFGVPCALANMIPLTTRGFNRLDISIPKLIWSRTKNRILKLDEIFCSDIANFQYSSQYESAQLQVIENTSLDISLLASEMLECLEGCGVANQDDEDRRIMVEAMVKDHHYSYKSAARYSISFLRNHPNLLSTTL